VALKQDGSVVAWGYNYEGQTSGPAGLSGVVSIAAGGYHTVALADPLPLGFASIQLGQASTQTLTLANLGALPLTLTGATFTGPDADQFSVVGTVPSPLAVGASAPLTVQFKPTRLGPMNAELHIASNDPETSDYVIKVVGYGTFSLPVIKAGSVGAGDVTYAPLRLDRTTGMILQQITFRNSTGLRMEGLKLRVTGLAAGVHLHSSSLENGALEVIYSAPVLAGETVSFDLVMQDPHRRRTAAVQPQLMLEPLMEPELRAGPMAGTLVPLLSAQSTAQGNLLRWTSVAQRLYVVEYSDDASAHWFSAVHQLRALGTQMFWMDRGQPETYSKPGVGVPNTPGGRQYRVRML
jgi:hypothetical protein